MEIEKYVLVRENTMHFDSEVNKYIAEGYVPIGNLCCVSETSNIYAMGMVKYKDPCGTKDKQNV